MEAHLREEHGEHLKRREAKLQKAKQKQKQDVAEFALAEGASSVSSRRRKNGGRRASRNDSDDGVDDSSDDNGDSDSTGRASGKSWSVSNNDDDDELDGERVLDSEEDDNTETGSDCDDHDDEVGLHATRGANETLESPALPIFDFIFKAPLPPCCLNESCKAYDGGQGKPAVIPEWVQETWKQAEAEKLAGLYGGKVEEDDDDAEDEEDVEAIDFDKELDFGPSKMSAR